MKNTVFLYTRTLVMMLLGLYSSRVTLDMLGASGYGTYQAIGGCITTLYTINAGISSAISRFITFELGRGDQTNLNSVFSTSINVLALFCVVVVIVAETVGLWFVHSHMQFPDGSAGSVNLIFHLCLVSYIVGMITMPFMSVLIAYEEFKYIATFGVLQGVLQFLLIIGISYLPSERLEWYAWSVFFTSVAYQWIYSYICIKRHPNIKYCINIDKRQFKSILSFASFSYIGSSAGVLRESGVTILLNTFFGVVYNAARGIAVSVIGAVSSLVGSFTTALTPQITKAYASGEFSYMWELVAKGIRFSYYLLFILAIPVLASTEWLLSLWLKDVPPMTVVFTQLTIITALCDTLSVPLISLMNATGKIVLYQCLVGGTLMLTVPIDLLLLYAGADAEILFWVNIIVSIVLFFLRIILIRRVVKFNISKFISTVLPRVMCVTAAVVGVIGCLGLCFSFMDGAFVVEVVKLACDFIIACLGVYVIGISKDERDSLHNQIKHYLPLS